MTRNLLILTMFFLSGLKLQAQCTPDNNITKPGFYPKALPEAVLNVAYSEVIQFKIVKDTSVVYLGQTLAATIDSAIVIGVTGMPPGIDFKLNKISKTYTPAEVGCALVSGTPTKAGTFNLKLTLNLFAKVGGFSVNRYDTIKSFSVIVKDPNAAIRDIVFDQKLVYPNPLKNEVLKINSALLKTGTKVSVYSFTGQLVQTQTLDGSEDAINFDFPKGLYFIKFEDKERVKGMRLMKE